MTTESIEPRDMTWLEKGVLGIEWSDGHRGVYPIRYLREHCPCAACVDEWTGERRVKPDDIPLLIMLKDIEPVGRYAFRLIWSDGHDSGIYTFSALRRMCQCGQCQPQKSDQSKPSSRRLL
ncbi:MAG: DUF971 domain-containing protein [Nitrospirae bacterium]|nr:MAG: DUF971 domain-containing protein [Nitrospirota bacterium]